jgi:hypothetical protein
MVWTCGLDPVQRAELAAIPGRRQAPGMLPQARFVLEFQPIPQHSANLTLAVQAHDARGKNDGPERASSADRLVIEQTSGAASDIVRRAGRHHQPNADAQ